MSHYCPSGTLTGCEAKKLFYDWDQTKIFLARLNNLRLNYKQNPTENEAVPFRRTVWDL